MIRVFMHNEGISRGTCGACREAPGVWTVYGEVPLIGSVKTDLCNDCAKRFDLLAWSDAAERRIVGELTDIVRKAIGE